MKHYSSKEVADIKGVSWRRVIHDLNDGKLVGYKDDKGQWLIPEPAVQEYVSRPGHHTGYQSHLEELDRLIEQVEKKSL
jgi:hypothetical protein